ncbi:MAG: FMN-binding glutamate synthase family protein, partial [Acidithiobacillus sp.]
MRGWTRWILPGIGLLLALVASFLAVRVDAWWFLLAALGWGIVALAIYDELQRQSALLANYPVLARLRGLALHLRPFFRSYLVEDDQEGKPYSYESRSLVYRRAAGISSTHPFGTQLDTYREGFNWITHSMAPVNRPAEKPRVLVGAEATEQPYSASVFNISALSFGAISGRAIESLVLGARL